MSIVKNNNLTDEELINLYENIKPIYHSLLIGIKVYILRLSTEQLREHTIFNLEQPEKKMLRYNLCTEINDPVIEEAARRREFNEHEEYYKKNNITSHSQLEKIQSFKYNKVNMGELEVLTVLKIENCCELLTFEELYYSIPKEYYSSAVAVEITNPLTVPYEYKKYMDEEMIKKCEEYDKENRGCKGSYPIEITLYKSKEIKIDK